MFKFVVFTCLVSTALAGVLHQPIQYAAVQHVEPVHVAYAAKTVVEPHYSVVEKHGVAHVGAVVKNIPTGVSHHSNSVVHSHASVVEPIYAHGIQKSVVSTPIVKQVVEHVHQPAVVHAAPIHYAAPAAYSSYAAPAAYASYAHAAPAVHAYSQPIVHAAPAHYAKAAYVQAPAHYASYPAVQYASAYHHQPAVHSAYAHHY